MALPDLIEIVPLDKPVRAEITVPGSKSVTNRALILAALADGETVLRGALWSEDTQIMVECLQELGFMVNVEPDPAEPCNRTITVYGHGGAVPPGGTEQQPMELFVGNAGTAARFLAAFVCLGHGVYRLSGIPRMHERPQAALFLALRELGYRVESEKGNDKLPVKIWGKAESGKRKAETKCRVSIEESSQFASALLLSAKHGGWEIEIVGENAEESFYISLTRQLIWQFQEYKVSSYPIEPDASSSSYFKAAGWLLAPSLTDSLKIVQVKEPKFVKLPQQDAMFSGYFRFGNYIGSPDAATKVTEISRLKHLADSIMTAIVMTPFAPQSLKFTDLGRLRVQECERVVALQTELTKCGAKVIEEGDTLTVYPSKLEELHGAEIETYNDHRMAMCFAILGLKVPGIKIKNPVCVKKTFPNFFQKLAASPPSGLGATILDAKTGRKLTHEELFAN
jgi:3-phosphoshikimate 1-carboxyvinyltransferase